LYPRIASNALGLFPGLASRLVEMTIGDERIGKWADVEMPSLVTVNLINTQKGADYWKSVGGIRGVRKLHILKPICSRDFLDLPIGDLEVLEELTFDLYDLDLADEEYFGQVYCRGPL